MKCYFLIFIFWLNVSYSHSATDYDLLNQVLPNLVGSRNIANFKIYERPANFENQSTFFTPSFFQDNAYRILELMKKKSKN